MELSSFFPIWDKLNSSQKLSLERNAVYKTVSKGAVIYGRNEHCYGILLVAAGQLRAYIMSDEGREITLYRLLERDICLFTAPCIMNSIQFEINITAEKNTGFWIISADTYKSIMEESAVLANFTNELMAARFTEVVWLIEQVMWKSLDKRVASFLLEESYIEETKDIKITHEVIAKHLGCHREVITRILHHFQKEGIVKLTRGAILIQDKKKLVALQNDK